MDRNNERFSQQGPSDRDAIQMNAQELAIYKECSRDAFVKRGLPYGSFTAGVTYVALKTGFLKPNAKFGYSPALISAALIGSAIGIVSYKAVCLQKVLEHPDSTLKQRIESSMRRYEHKTGQISGNLSGIPTVDILSEDSNTETRAPMVSGLQMENYSSNDYGGFTNINADSDQLPNYESMDPILKFGGTPTSYDELRQRNRDDYSKSQSTRLPPGQDNRQFAAPQTPILEGNIPFDRDRVPQYQLVD